MPWALLVQLPDLFWAEARDSHVQAGRPAVHITPQQDFLIRVA